MPRRLVCPCGSTYAVVPYSLDTESVKVTCYLCACRVQPLTPSEDVRAKEAARG